MKIFLILSILVASALSQNSPSGPFNVNLPQPIPNFLSLPTDVLTSIFGGVQGVNTQVVNSIPTPNTANNGGVQILSALISSIGNILQGVPLLFVAGTNTVTNAATSINGNQTQFNLANAINGIVQALTGLGQIISNVLNGILGTSQVGATSIINNFVAQLQTNPLAAIQSIALPLATALGATGGIIQQGIASFINVFAPLINSLGPIVYTLGGPGAVQQVAGFLQDAYNIIAALFQSIGNPTQQLGANLSQG